MLQIPTPKFENRLRHHAAKHFQHTPLNQRLHVVNNICSSNKFTLQTSIDFVFIPVQFYIFVLLNHNLPFCIFTSFLIQYPRLLDSSSWYSIRLYFFKYAFHHQTHKLFIQQRTINNMRNTLFSYFFPGVQYLVLLFSRLPVLSDFMHSYAYPDLYQIP